MWFGYGGQWDEGRTQVCQRSLQRVVVIVWDGDAVQLRVPVEFTLVCVDAQPVLLQDFLQAVEEQELLQGNMTKVVTSNLREKEKSAGKAPPTCCSRTCTAPFQL